MHYSDALTTIGAVRAGGARVSWVSPAMSVCLAAERTRPGFAVHGAPLPVDVVGDAARYADYVGLTEAMAGTDPIHQQGFLHGKSYSPLEWLYDHGHIHRCTQTMGELFRAQLGQANPLWKRLTKITGELHDNVASHSHGRGFAAAQVYRDKIEYAIADAGCGLLRNARRIDGRLGTDFEAIDWSFVRGNTCCPTPVYGGPPPQRGMGGSELGLYAADGDSHAGWGLDELRQMIDETGGTLWVATGLAGCTYSMGNWTPFNLSTAWDGVFIEFQVPRGATA